MRKGAFDLGFESAALASREPEFLSGGYSILPVSS